MERRTLITKWTEDEVFVNRDLGYTVDVSALIDLANDGKLPLKSFRTRSLVAARPEGMGLNRTHLAKLPPARLGEPLLVFIDGGRLWVLDGNHRLERRRQLSLDETAAFVVSPRVLGTVRGDLPF